MMISVSWRNAYGITDATSYSYIRDYHIIIWDEPVAYRQVKYLMLMEDGYTGKCFSSAIYVERAVQWQY